MLCLLAAQCSKAVNELQRYSLLQKKMYVFDVCACVRARDACVWAAEKGSVMCLLLLMSHDFPAFTTLQNVSVLASEIRNQSSFLNLVTHVVAISQEGEKILLL